jgi:hypothetical protein
MKSVQSRKITAVVMFVGTIFITGCSGGSFTAREKGAGIGALGGAAVGGIIGSAVGHPGAGAAIGGGLGLGAGALVGDQMQGGRITEIPVKTTTFAAIKRKSTDSARSWRD